MLTQIDFEYFRGFRRLTLDGLQRVNLIVGKNNSGKTSLMEGIAALVNPRQAPEQISRLRQLEQHLAKTFERDRFSDWVIHDASSKGKAILRGSEGDRSWRVTLIPAIPRYPDSVAPRGSSSAGSSESHGDEIPAIPSGLVSAHHRTPEQLVETFGKAMLRKGAEELLEATLKEVDSRIQKVRVLPSEKSTHVVVDIGLSKLVPISQAGQGIYRLVEIFSEIIGAEARVAFIDEVENGIHHSCLVDLWTGIAEAAQRFDVQVFATTHSYECIEAAHAAFLERPSYDFGIIQLFRESKRIQGRVLDQEHIEAAIEGNIDLRG